MDGRDIGTTVFPDAELKLWVTASIEVRTARRYKELLEKGHQVTFEEVKENVGPGIICCKAKPDKNCSPVK